MATDIARLDRPNMNIVRASKHFRSLTIDRLTCQDGCTVQGVDMGDWIGKSVMSNLNYTIQGSVYIRNPIISYIDALGLVNNVTFDSQNILLKSADQYFDGPVTIGNRNSLSSLTFDNLNVNFINDKNVSEFFENLIRAGDTDVGEIFTNMIFMEPVEFLDLNVSELNGVDMDQLTAADQQYRAAAAELDVMVDKLAQRDKFKHFDQPIVRQTFPLEVQGLRKLLGYEFAFVAFNHSNIQLYLWNSTMKTLQENNGT